MNKDKINRFILDNILENQGILKELEIYAKDNNIPIVDKETANLLSVLVKIVKPKRILEIGTAIGYSSILMANSYEEANIITIERNKDMIEIADSNIRNASLSNRINIQEGDALNILNQIDGTFDLIFIDGAKGQYKRFFEMTKDLTVIGSVIISDNILFRDLEINDKNKRYKTIIKRMKDYIRYINALDNYKTSILNTGDGLALSVRIF